MVHAGIPLDVTAHLNGTYVCMEGPQFSTRAESLMHRKWGGDLIGMTAMPEAKLAREAQMCYALVALASDYDAWREHDKSKGKQTLLQEILSNLHKATDNCLTLIRALLAGDAPLVDESCPCRRSLELAVWTAPGHISPAEKDRLAVLFEYTWSFAKWKLGLLSRKSAWDFLDRQGVRLQMRASSWRPARYSPVAFQGPSMHVASIVRRKNEAIFLPK